MTITLKLRHIVFTGTAALAIACAALHPVQAAPAGIPTFGSVDITKVQTLSTRKAKYDNDLHALADKLDALFRRQTTSVMLTSAEQTELGGLLGKASPTDSDRARITALETKASADAQQLTDLQQKKDPSAADTNQLATLTSEYEAGKGALQEIGDGYQNQLKSLSDADNAEFTRNVKDAIAAVAQQKGLSVVFTSDVAIYTANDITEDVVKRINK